MFLKKMLASVDKYLYTLNEQFLYIVFGGLTTLVNWGVYTLFLQFFALGVSNTIAWVVAVSFAFTVNKMYVFKHRGTSFKQTVKELTLFFPARALSGVFEIAGLPLLVHLGLDQRIFGIEGAVAKLIISVAVIVSNYIFSKYVIFKK